MFDAVTLPETDSWSMESSNLLAYSSQAMTYKEQSYAHEAFGHNEIILAIFGTA